MIVNPAPDALVRDPVTLLAIVDGADVDETTPYFARLITDGDLVAEIPEPAEAEAGAVAAEPGAQAHPGGAAHDEDAN